jgi:WD40 repeat protein
VALGFDSAASLMVVATTAETLELWDIPQRKHLATLSLELPSTDPVERGAARALALSAQRAFLAAGTDTGLVHLWNFKDRAKSGPLATPPPVPGEARKPPGAVAHLEFNPAESRLALLRESGALEIWDPVRRVQLHRVQLPEAEPRRLRYSPDGGHLLIAYNSGGIVSVDAQTGTVLDTIRVPRGRAVNVDYTADGVPVASLARGSTVQVWDLLRLGRVATLGAFPTRLLDVTIARYGETALTLAAGGYVDHWDLCSGRHLGRQRLLTPAPREMHKAHEEHRVLVCGPRDGLLAYEGFEHNSTTPLEPVPLPVPRPGRGEQVVTYSVSPDQRLVALAYSTGDARLYGYQSPSDPQVLPGTGAPLTTVCFSPDQQYLVTGDAEGRLRLWDPVVGRVEWEDQSARLPIHMVAFTPSGRLLSVPRGNVIEVWNLEHRRRVARLEGHEAPIRTLVHGLEGRLLLSSSDDGTARMWDMAQQRSLRVLGDHPGPVTAATFDASLRLLLTTSGPYLSIWRVADAALLARCSYLGQREGTRHPRWVSFTPDGAYAASERAPLGVEFTRPRTRVRTSDAERDALFDPRAVARRLLGE